MDENKGCKNCKHFLEYHSRPGYGECHLNPPQVFCDTAGDVRTEFPSVSANTICGQYAGCYRAAERCPECVKLEAELEHLTEAFGTRTPGTWPVYDPRHCVEVKKSDAVRAQRRVGGVWHDSNCAVVADPFTECNCSIDG